MKPITENTSLEDVKKALTEAGKRVPGDLWLRANSLRQIYSSRITCDAFFTDQVRKDTVLLISDLMQAIWNAKGDLRSQDARNGGNAKAAKLQEPKEKICQAWATGKFESRDLCAEQEYSNLGFSSFKTARNALMNTPAPSSWTAKKIKKK